MRIVYMGSPAGAVSPLQYLLDHGATEGAEVVAVVSQPARELGRGRKVQDPPVAQYAKERGLRTLQPPKASATEFVHLLRGLSPDVVVTCAYGQILSDEFLACPRRATINIHPSRLPQYRGATPVQAALLAGDTSTAITVLFTVKKLDAGAIIVQQEVPISPEDRAGGLIERLFGQSGPLLLQALIKLKDKQFTGIAQDESKVVLCKKIEKEDGRVRWETSAVEIVNRFRAFHPWPGSYTFYKGRRITLDGIELPHAPATQVPPNLPGSFEFDKIGDCLRVRTGDGVLAVGAVKPEGKGLQSARDFWNGVKGSGPHCFTS